MLVASGLFIYLLSQQGWAEIWSAITSIAIWRFMLAFLMMGISRLAISLRWYALLEIAQSKIRFPEALKITLAGLFATNFLPTTIGGDVVRLAGGMQRGLEASLCTASLVADRLVGMLGMAMAVPFSLPGLPALQEFYSKPAGYLPATSQPLTMLAIAGKWWHSLLEKTRAFLSELLQSLKVWLNSPESILKSLAYSWINMLCLFAVLKMLLDGVGEPISFWLIAGMYSLVYFLTLIPISINGYGIQELSIMLIFSHMGKVSVSSSLTAALLFRTLMMFASLPGAIFLPGIFAFSRQEKLEHQPDRTGI